MCDMRGPPSKIKDGDEVKLLKYNGHLDRELKEPLVIGIYHVGASGCGYDYWDGQEFWIIGQNNKGYQYKGWWPSGQRIEKYEFIYDNPPINLNYLYTKFLE